MRGMRLCCLLFPFALASRAQEMVEFQKKISDFTLPNGLHFLVLEQHDSPVIAFHTWIRVGSVDDPAGQTGLTHMFEHVALKGSENLGTRNWTEEKKALDAVEEALNKADAEARKGQKADRIRVDGLRSQAGQAAEIAQRYAGSGEFRRYLDENGAINLRVSANVAYTESSYSLPSNRAELWYFVESQNFSHPVYREFYSERSAMMEEYRQRVEGTPQARLMSELLATAFKAHPYRNPPGGWLSDVANLRRSEALEFFERYYVPGNITVAIVGDITPVEAKRLADKYFGSIPAKPLPPRVMTQEPQQIGPKTVVVELQGQPMTMIGYKRPNQFDKDDMAMDLIQVLFSQGRSGLLYSDLVTEKRVAQQAQAVATNPDGSFPNLFTFFLVPAQGHSVEDVQRALEELLRRFEATPLDPQMVARAKLLARANMIRRISNNEDLAGLLALHAGSYGDWRRLFTQLDELAKLTPGDLQRAASRYFVPTGRTTVYSVLPGQSDAPKPAERRTGGLQ